MLRRSAGRVLLCGVVRAAENRLPSGFAVVNRCMATVEYEHGKFRSDAQEKISKIPAIEVDGDVAVCEGGSGVLGHPIEYIQLDNVRQAGAGVCKYCGLRYVKAKHGHGHGNNKHH